MWLDNPPFMDVGTVVFYQHEDRFKEILQHMKVSERELSLDDDEFQNKHGYGRQSVFHTLYQSDDMWGFICSTVKKRDGSTAYKILNHKESVKEIGSDSLYFILKMDDYTYTHWAEMKTRHSIIHSPNGSRILKKPSEKVKKSAKKLELKLLQDKMLYQIVETQANDWLDYYPSTSSNNSRWEKYQPYYLDPTMKSMTSPYQQPRHYPNPQDPDSRQWPNYYPKRKTIHGIPFIRDNLKPSTFSVVSHRALAENKLCVFVNFPNGLPCLKQ
tara:strand:- start:216 stop:1028 length:813 start_codon:yes stop_codon:yes gene_type:complete